MRLLQLILKTKQLELLLQLESEPLIYCLKKDSRMMHNCLKESGSGSINLMFTAATSKSSYRGFAQSTSIEQVLPQFHNYLIWEEVRD